MLNPSVQRRSPNSENRRISAQSQPQTPDRISTSGGSPHRSFPPTPPLPGAASFDFMPQIARGSVSPALSGVERRAYFPSSVPTTNPEAYATKHSAYPPIPEPQQWRASTSPSSSRRQSDESAMSATTKSDSAYPEVPTTAASPGLAQQRPLPTDFPPPAPALMPVARLSPSDTQVAHAQFHHHYPTNTSNYSPSSDRYQCNICQKAFSRPSSLKIHSYSHTGEKPFKCKHEGCGKFFSVRSNMKRHEKGCHGLELSSVGSNSPKADLMEE